MKKGGGGAFLPLIFRTAGSNYSEPKGTIVEKEIFSITSYFDVFNENSGNFSINLMEYQGEKKLQYD